jgi:VWFA-related protein
MRMRIAVTIGVLLLLVAPGRGAGQAPGAPQQPSFKTVTTLVEVDVIVKDRNGKFVPDLTAADFEVREDGAVQTIEQLYLVAGPEATSAVPVPNSPALPAVPAPPALPAPATQRTFVLLFDENNMQAGGLARARDAALQFLAEEFREGDIGGVVSNGTMVNNRLTTAHAELEAAVKSLKPWGETRSVQLDMREWPRLLNVYEVYLIAEKEDSNALGVAVSRACNDDPDACPRVPVDQMVKEKARRMMPQFRGPAQQTMRTIRAVAGGLRKLPGRKTIILLSDGFFVDDEWANLRQMTDEANRASARIYAIDTRGLNRGSASSDILDMGPHGAVTPGGELPGVTGFDTTSDGPNSLAVDTGGLAIRNENDFVKAFADIAADTSRYYILGYRSTNTKFDGKFRQITVRVKTRGLSVRARKGYLATPPALVAPTAAPNPPAAAGAGAEHPNAPAAALRPQPDVKERVAALEKVTPERARPGASSVPENVLAQARAGWDAYQHGDVRGAKAALLAAAAHPAAPAWIHYTLGWSRYALGEYEAAGTEWERVRGGAPEFEPVYFDLADSYLQQREFGRRTSRSTTPSASCKSAAAPLRTRSRLSKTPWR